MGKNSLAFWQWYWGKILLLVKSDYIHLVAGIFILTVGTICVLVTNAWWLFLSVPIGVTWLIYFGYRVKDETK